MSLNTSLLPADDLVFPSDAAGEADGAASAEHDPRAHDPPCECEVCTFCPGPCSRCQFRCRWPSFTFWTYLCAALGWWGGLCFFILEAGWAVFAVAPAVFAVPAVWIYCAWYCSKRARRAASAKMLFMAFSLGALPSVAIAIGAELLLNRVFSIALSHARGRLPGLAVLGYFINAFFIAAGVEESIKVWASRGPKALCASTCCFRCWAPCRCGASGLKCARYCQPVATPGRPRDGCLGSVVRQPIAYVLYTMVAAMGFSTMENFEYIANAVAGVQRSSVCVEGLGSNATAALFPPHGLPPHGGSNATGGVPSDVVNKIGCELMGLGAASLTVLTRAILSFPLHAICGGLSGVGLYLLAKPRTPRSGFCACAPCAAERCTRCCGATVTCAWWPLGALGFALCYGAAILTHGTFDFFLFSLGGLGVGLPGWASSLLQYVGTAIILLAGATLFAIALTLSGVLRADDFDAALDEEIGLAHLQARGNGNSDGGLARVPTVSIGLPAISGAGTDTSASARPDERAEAAHTSTPDDGSEIL